MNYSSEKSLSSCGPSIDDRIKSTNKSIKVAQDLIDSLHTFAIKAGNYSLRGLKFIEGYGQLRLDISFMKKEVKRLMKKQEKGK